VIAASHLELGQLDRAKAALAGLRTPERLPAVEVPVLLVVRALVRLAEGRAGDALVDALEAGRWTPSPADDARSAVVSWRLAAALARLALGQVAEARHLAEEESEHAREGEITRLMIGCRRVLGLAAEGRRRMDLLAEAVSIGSEHPRRLEYLRALLDLGGATRRANRRAAAQVPLGRAVELSRDWGAIALGRQAQTELAACGARRVGAPEGGLDALTPSERRVATLAASGHTTRQIAAELFVTAKTVEFHLRHIYRKLGIPSTRADLAAALAGNDPRTAGNG
jgi:DNA-binding CsgD family transcriptional regulator